MKILVVGVGYSPNLGDGVIAECTKSALEALGCETLICDLAGRSGYVAPAAGKKLSTRILARLPEFIRARLSFFLLSGLIFLVLKSYYRKMVRGVDAVVLGGGESFC